MSHRLFSSAVMLALIGVMLPDLPVAAIDSAKVPFVRDQWTNLSLEEEGIQVLRYRMSLTTKISANPFKSGSGPAMYLKVKNTGSESLDFSLAVALFNGKGILLGASTSGHVGELDPEEEDEIKLIFRDVNLSISDATLMYVSLETHR